MFRSPRIATFALLFAAAAPLRAQELSDRLSVHGYLTQAYGRTSELPMMGMSKDGTTDYRAAAIQLRYGMTDNDNFVVQLQHRRVGEHVMMTMTDDVEVDWAFYERKLPRSTSLRVGKMPIAVGIFNEVRDVGVLLPFHQAPDYLYADGLETIEGILLTHTVGAGRDFSLEVSGYAGEWSLIETDYGMEAIRAARARNKNTLGSRFWLTTPIEGLELGVSVARYDATGGLDRPAGVRMANKALVASINGDFARFDLRGEYIKASVDDGTTKYDAYYGQGGVQLTSLIQLNTQLQIGNLVVQYPGFTWDVERGRDFALGIKLTPMPNLAIKFEGHRARGYMWSQPVNPMAPGPKGTYAIAGVAVSF
jgi:hypothetical protein